LVDLAAREVHESRISGGGVQRGRLLRSAIPACIGEALFDRYFAAMNRFKRP